MRRYTTIIVVLFIIVLIASLVEPIIGNISQNSKKYDELNNLAFSDIPHSNDVLDPLVNKNTNTEPTFTNEILAKEMIRLSWGVLAFGCFLVLFIGAIVLKKNSGWDQELTRIFTVSVVVTAGLFLITIGYTDQQIAPMFGLLGTMVGYILGKYSSPEENTNQNH